MCKNVFAYTRHRMAKQKSNCVYSYMHTKLDFRFYFGATATANNHSSRKSAQKHSAHNSRYLKRARVSIQFRVVCKRNDLRSTNLTKCFAIEITNNFAWFCVPVSYTLPLSIYRHCVRNEYATLMNWRRVHTLKNGIDKRVHQNNFHIGACQRMIVERSSSINENNWHFDQDYKCFVRLLSLSD